MASFRDGVPGWLGFASFIGVSVNAEVNEGMAYMFLYIMLGCVGFSVIKNVFRITFIPELKEVHVAAKKLDNEMSTDGQSLFGVGVMSAAQLRPSLAGQ